MKNRMEYGKDVFKKWPNERNFQVNIIYKNTRAMSLAKHCQSSMHSEIQ